MSRIRMFSVGNHAVSFHNFKSQNFKLSVSNPKNKYVAYLSVLSRISNCQGLGRKNKHDILKTDRMFSVGNHESLQDIAEFYFDAEGTNHDIVQALCVFLCCISTLKIGTYFDTMFEGFCNFHKFIYIKNCTSIVHLKKCTSIISYTIYFASSLVFHTDRAKNPRRGPICTRTICLTLVIYIYIYIHTQYCYCCVCD